MNFSFYIYGTPNGYNQYPTDNNCVAFQEYAASNTTESQLTICRKGQLIYYAYMRRLQEKSSSYLGLCLIFNGIYCCDSVKIFELFEKAYFGISLKGEILRIDKNGKVSYVTDKFVNKQTEINRIKAIFNSSFHDFFQHDFANIDPPFRIGNGSKIISINEGNSKINDVILECDYVHITNNEKYDSEFDRLHKMLSEHYSNKQDLINDLLNHKLSVFTDNKIKKPRKWPWIVLFIVLVCCGIVVGFVLNNNAQKEKKIALQNEIIAQTKVVRVSINMETVYWANAVQCYHLFHNYSLLKNNTVVEGSIEEAFNSDKKQLCNECINMVSTYKDHRKNARELYNIAIDLQDERYFDFALDYCNKALEMRPDDKRMNERKQEIELKK